MFKVGDKVTVKDTAWRKFCVKHGYDPSYPNIGEQNIIRVIDNSVYSMFYLLTFPLVWWSEDDLELVEQIVYEQVDAIQRNGKAVRRGDILRCSCRYEVFTLYPVWDSKTGKHLKDHSNNSFSCRLIESCMCPVHGKKK